MKENTAYDFKVRGFIQRGLYNDQLFFAVCQLFVAELLRRTGNLYENVGNGFYLSTGVRP